MSIYSSFLEGKVVNFFKIQNFNVNFTIKGYIESVWLLLSGKE